MVMDKRFTAPVMLRLTPQMRKEIWDQAQLEGNTESAVMRRLLALGLAATLRQMQREQVASE